LEDDTEIAGRRRDPDRLADRRRRGEEEGGTERSDWGPAADDHRGQPDEPAARRHARRELSEYLHREERSPERSESAGEDDVSVAQADHVDPDRLGGTWVLTHGPGPEPPARPEQEDLEEDHQDDE